MSPFRTVSPELVAWCHQLVLKGVAEEIVSWYQWFISYIKTCEQNIFQFLVTKIHYLIKCIDWLTEWLMEYIFNHATGCVSFFTYVRKAFQVTLLFTITILYTFCVPTSLVVSSYFSYLLLSLFYFPQMIITLQDA